MPIPLIQNAAWIDLVATAALAWRSRQMWLAYHRAHASRGQMVNQLFLTGVVGAADVVLFALGYLL